MDNEIVCNHKKCRKRLSKFAWVTSCSHIFCDDDGTQEFNKAFVCPACETSLPNKFDILRIDIQPTEQYKSMVLAGQKPETIMEICSRALAFWTYQVHQERTYQDYVVTKSREKVTQLEYYYEQIITQTQTEINNLKTNLSTSRKELDELKKRYHEVSDKVLDKNRQYQKLQSMYDALRRRCITPAGLDTGLDFTPSRRVPQEAFNMAITTGDDILRGAGGDHHPVRPPPCMPPTHSPAVRDFVLRPRATPVLSSAEKRSNADRSAIKRHFNMELGTPGSRR